MIKKKITEPHCVDDIFSVLVGCDVELVGPSDD